MNRFVTVLLVVFITQGVFAHPQVSISGAVEWDTLRLNAEVMLDMASAGLRLPAGRNQGEALLLDGFRDIIKHHILDLRVDSSSTVGDLVNRGELTLSDIETLAFGANSLPPAMRPDLRHIFSSHEISLSTISNSLLQHHFPTPVIRTLSPVTTPRFTGIIIIATESLPVHGMRGTALPVPSLFPRIWDSEMNLIYERSMVETRNAPIVRYAPMQDILQNTPSGLTPELQQIVGDRPLRIFAQGVFGIAPTDLIIDRNDALLIISSDENRRLLTQGRVAIILDESVLRYEFGR
ncbi:MAG: polymerase [Treponema sp.]|nr:polymerase [Treponema sp.]